MQPKTAGLLWDVVTAATTIGSFVEGKSWHDYAADALLRSAVERQFEIAGEAMSVLRKLDPLTAERVPNARKVIGMRNVLIHGYAEVNDRTVWQAATEQLEELIDAARALLAEMDSDEVG